MKKYVILILVLLMAVAGIASGCSAKEIDNPTPTPTPFERTSDEELLPEELPDGASGSLIVPQVIGTILEIQDDGKLILVDSKNETGDQVEGEIWITITDETYFFEDVDEDSSLGIMNVSRDFKVGNKVSVLTGPIAESYPMQAEALSVYENVEQ